MSENKLYSDAEMLDIHRRMLKLNERMKHLNGAIEDGEFGRAHALAHSLGYQAGELKSDLDIGLE